VSPRRFSLRAALLCALALCVTAVCSLLPAQSPESARPLVLVVMDPLAAPLACACVRGYAQRDYAKLGAYLEGKLHRPVKVVFDDDLAGAMSGADGRADLIVGKQATVLYDARECKLAVRPLAMLTGKDGSTTITGLFVVPSRDPAKTAADLKGYRIFFGGPEAEEKNAAAKAALRAAGVPVAEMSGPETSCRLS